MLVDQTAFLKLSKRQSTGGNGVVLIKHFVCLTVKKNSPIPWDALLNVTLRANGRRAVTCNRVVPARMLVHKVERVYIFAKSFARFVCGLQCPVKINIF